MKAPILPLSFLFIVAPVFGANIAILSPDEVVEIDTTSNSAASTDSAKAAFLTAFEDTVTSGATFEATLHYENPPEWGKTLSEKTTGKVEYHRAFDGGFVCRLTLEGLAANNEYILTLNGNPERKGNDLLQDPVPGNEAERYYDFLSIQTDEKGAYQAMFGIFLTPSDYDVRLYVKDTADFKIVLYRDFFEFTVE